MTKRQFLLLAATAAVSASATIFVDRALRDEAPVPGAVPVTLRSTVLGEDRELFVHLPEGYAADSSARYPVLYVLDGTAQSGHTAQSAGLLARIGTIPPTIVIGVPSLNGDTRNRDYTPPYMRLDTDAPTSAMGAADRFLSFLQTELIPRVDRDYRTTRPQMLAGWSRGGLFVVYSELAAPGLFDAKFAHSPALWREDDLIVGRLQDALASGRQPPGFLYLSLGDQENERMTGSFRHAVSVLGRYAPPAFRWRADLSTGGQHESNPRLATPVGLCVVFRPDLPCQGRGIRPVAADAAPASAADR